MTSWHGSQKGLDIVMLLGASHPALLCSSTACELPVSSARTLSCCVHLYPPSVCSAPCSSFRGVPGTVAAREAVNVSQDSKLLTHLFMSRIIALLVTLWKNFAPYQVRTVLELGKVQQ